MNVNDKRRFNVHSVLTCLLDINHVVDKSNAFDRSISIEPTTTAKNVVNSLNFLVWKFCGKALFPHQELR